MAAMARGHLAIMTKDEIWQLIYVDDFAWTVYGQNFVNIFMITLFFYTVMGLPFALHKCGGGQEYEWIGYWMDLRTFSTGISTRRKDWLQGWLAKVTSDNAVVVRNLVEVLGRMQFAPLAIPVLRPYLGPIYAWAAVMPKNSCSRLPLASG